MGDYEFIVVQNILEDFVTYYDSIDTSSITKYYLDMILGFENHVLRFHLKLVDCSTVDGFLGLAVPVFSDLASEAVLPDV